MGAFRQVYIAVFWIQGVLVGVQQEGAQQAVSPAQVVQVLTVYSMNLFPRISNYQEIFDINLN